MTNLSNELGGRELLQGRIRRQLVGDGSSQLEVTLDRLHRAIGMADVIEVWRSRQAGEVGDDLIVARRRRGILATTRVDRIQSFPPDANERAGVVAERRVDVALEH